MAALDNIPPHIQMNISYVAALFAALPQIYYKIQGRINENSTVDNTYLFVNGTLLLQVTALKYDIHVAK